ncbi:MAG TPA: glucose 1-dehydrogenase [Lichenihabitans sp.]|jgi:NAD(P)-dependent dehydrogenase (short-subunit alcohol dehydrogenase family)|nr:glucose 1-dehydrogenase [Lichenihabitans sp.]
MYLDLFRLAGKTAVVTGGGGAIGLATCHALGEAGARVVVADRVSDAARQAQRELQGAGIEADMVELDVTRPSDVRAAAETLNRKHGAVDILVANAGIARSGTPSEHVEDEQWLNVVDVNLNGVFWCCRDFGKFMLERGHGSIVTVGSMSGVIANKPQAQTDYNASKAAVHHLTKSLAAEWGARGVRINSVAPTYIETPMTKSGAAEPGWLDTWLAMTPMHRMGQPREIASVILFLASEAASLLTGAVVLADGGYTCW